MLVKLLLLALMATATFAADQPREEKTKGEDVTTAVIDEILSSKIFPDDHDFLRRVAYVESKFGEDPNTYRPNYSGGIWQLDEKQFNDLKDLTLHPSLSATYSKIQSVMNIDMVSATWNDLLKPLYSGLAARLLISTVEAEQNVPIPQTIELQAKYWLQYYTQRDGMTEKIFHAAAFELENKTGTCKGKMDLLVLLDGSGSVGQSDFTKSLQFVADLLASYSSGSVRKGFIQFSSGNEAVFSLSNSLSDSEITSKVLSTRYLNAGTNTNGGILASVRMYKDTTERPVPKVLCVFTDGASNEGGNGGGGVPDIVQAQKANISTYAIGIGSYINQNELQEIANNEASRIFQLNDFDVLKKFYTRLNKETCSIAQTQALNVTTKDVLEQNERRYYDFNIPPAGLTVSVDMVSGKTEGYYSYSRKTPSAALNDGVLKTEKTFIPRSTDPGAGTNVFVAVKGLETSNDYTIVGQEGDSTCSCPKN